MHGNKIYKLHESFDKAYSILSADPQTGYDGHKEALNYHHKPEKLEVFENYVGYLFWFNELFVAGQRLISEYQKLNQRINLEKSNWFRRKSHINNILNDLNSYERDIHDFRLDVEEFQRCMVATSIHEKHDYVETLYEQIRFINSLETNILTTGNRKLSEINSTRLQLTGLAISICAFITSVISIYIAATK